MNPSPSSAVSSSDPCHSSGSVEREARSQTSFNLPPGSEPLLSPLEARKLEAGDPTRLHSGEINQQLSSHTVGHGPICIPSESGTRIFGMANGELQRHHKRKWEDDDGTDAQEDPSNVKKVEGMTHLSGNTSFGSQRHASNQESGESSGDWSGKKRPKANQDLRETSSRTGNPFETPLLAAEIWQHIFCFVPPVSLGRLLRVNRAFNAYLTPEQANEQVSEIVLNSVVQRLDPQAIWAASRRRFCPGLPKPIRGIHELDMWRLLRGRDCQVCHEKKEPNLTLNPENPWESGPGDKGARVLWPFAVRCCGKCISKISEKEVNLFFSSDCPTILLPALPFAFISPSNNYIPSTLIRSTATLPPLLQMAKYYYKPHIEEIKQRLHGARELGNASAEEWIKGLDDEGRERLNEAARWEQWFAKGNLKRVNVPPQIKSTGIPGHTIQEPRISNTKVGTHSDQSTPQGVRLPTRLGGDTGSPALSSPDHVQYPQHLMSSSYQPPWIPATSSTESTLPRNQVSFPQPRPERNIRDVNEAKAARRAEIERRCADLDPPLLPNVLAHMETFQAAIQISQPLSEHAWQVLKPRLLTQRAYAERREKDRVEQSQLLQAEYKQRRQQEAQLKETKESLDREWTSIQAPIRNQIADLADEIIETRWARGKGVTKDNCPKFAADVLLYVRRRFYDEVARENEDVISNGENLKSENTDSATSRILILENMKWLFDTKIKPFTENFQKELFLCNGCDGNFKFYGLDSVVQHYAAKHTHDLSLGTQVVHWRAEWPEHPPFHPEPSVAKATYYKIPTPQLGSVQALPIRDLPTPINHEGYTRVTKSMPHLPQQAYDTSQYSPRSYQEQYTQHYQQDRQYSPPTTQNHPHSIPGGFTQSQDFQQSSNFGPVYSAPPSAYANKIHTNGVFQPSNLGASQPDHPAASGYSYTDSYVQDQRTSGWQGFDSFQRNHGGSSVTQHQPNLQTASLNSHPPYPEQVQDPAGPPAELYQPQIEEMAKYTRDFWFATSGIKDIPQSVRIFVVIQHMVARFKALFANEPSLAMFIDGLDHNALMRPVRTLNGLACKVCVTHGSGASGEQNMYTSLPTGDRRLYTLPHLLNHFRTAHLEVSQAFGNIENPALDWKRDMIELPEKPLIADLINAPGLDDVKLELIARVFPGVFPSPLPRIGAAGNIGPVPVYTGGFDSGTRPLSNIFPEPFSHSPSRGEVRVESQHPDRSYSSFRELSQPARLSEPPGDDEYDPHRPALPLGVGLVHPRKPARTPSTDGGKPSKSHTRHDNFPYLSSDVVDRPRSTYHDGSSRRVAGDQHSLQYYDSNSRARSRLSSQNRTEAGPEDPFNEEQVSHHDQHVSLQQNGHGAVVEPSAKQTRISDGHEVGLDSTSFKQRPQSPSLNEGASAADQFLDNLASSPDLNPGSKIVPLDREETRSIVRREELSQDQYRKKPFEPAVESQGWRVDVGGGQRAETDQTTLPTRKDSVKGRSNDEISSPHVRHSSHQYNDNRPLSSQVQRLPPNESRAGRRSSEAFASYDPPPQTIIQDRFEVRGSVIEGPRIRDGSFHVAQTPRYRSRSRSPRPMPLGTTYYRTRSPADDHRHEPVYHIRSPTLRKDVHSQRIISYDYPMQDRYGYVEDRNISHNQLRPRVEYVPVRLREPAPIESSRFVIAQSTEMRPQPDFVRLDRGYTGAPLYERHGPIYHTDPGSYHPQQDHGAPTFPQGYRY